MIKIDGISEVLATLKKVENINAEELNTRRGEKYTGFLVKALRRNQLNLQPIKAATVKRRIKDLGGPLFDTGETAKTARIKTLADSVEAGFFQGDKRIRGKIDAADLMAIHAEGRGRNPKRDWLTASADLFDKTDDKIIDKYLDEIFKNI